MISRICLAALCLGAIVLPAMPAFYNRPGSLADQVDFIVGRICDQLGIENRLLRRWGEADSSGT